MLQTALRDDALTATPRGFELRVGLPWIRSMPLSGLAGLAVVVDGVPLEAGALTVVLGSPQRGGSFTAGRGRLVVRAGQAGPGRPSGTPSGRSHRRRRLPVAGALPAGTSRLAAGSALPLGGPAGTWPGAGAQRVPRRGLSCPGRVRAVPISGKQVLLLPPSRWTCRAPLAPAWWATSRHPLRLRRGLRALKLIPHRSLPTPRCDVRVTEEFRGASLCGNCGPFR